MNTDVPIRVVMTLRVSESLDARTMAGRLLNFLTSQAEVKRVDPTRIQEQVDLADGGLSWRDVEYQPAQR